MSKTYKYLLSLLMLLVMVSLTGCGDPFGLGGSSASTSGSGAYYTTESYDTASADYEISPAISKISANSLNMAAQEESGSTGSDGYDIFSDTSRKLIRTVDLSMESKEIENTAQEISRKVTQLGGYIEQSSMNSRYDKNVYITARVPADRLDEFIEVVEGAGNILSKNENVQDITLQYSDTESHIASLKVEQERLNELMTKAEDIETILAIEDKLTDIRYELESYESTKRRYDNQVDYATVTISIDEVETYTPPVKKGLWERITGNFDESLQTIKEDAENFIVWLLGDSPILLIRLLIIVIVVLVIRRLWNPVKNFVTKREAGAAKRRAKMRADAAAQNAEKAQNMEKSQNAEKSQNVDNAG